MGKGIGLSSIVGGRSSDMAESLGGSINYIYELVVLGLMNPACTFKSE